MSGDKEKDDQITKEINDINFELESSVRNIDSLRKKRKDLVSSLSTNVIKKKKMDEIAERQHAIQKRITLLHKEQDAITYQIEDLHDAINRIELEKCHVEGHNWEQDYSYGYKDHEKKCARCDRISTSPKR
jgi:seryl-tRNA synthetase